MGAGKKPEPIPWWCVGVSTVAFRQPHVEKSAKGGMGRIQGCGINGKAKGGGGGRVEREMRKYWRGVGRETEIILENHRIPCIFFKVCGVTLVEGEG